MLGNETVNAKRQIEIFGAGCPTWGAESRIKDLGCPLSEVVVLVMKDAATAQRPRGLGVRSAPAFSVDRKLTDCCSGRGQDDAVLAAAGLGRPLRQSQR